MLKAYKKFWKGYVDFEGRASRSDFWWLVLCQAILGVIWTILIAGLSILAMVILGTAGAEGLVWWGSVILVILLIVYVLASLLPSVALSVRRIRDTGRPWPYVFFYFVPIVGAIIILIFCCQPTDSHASKEK